MDTGKAQEIDALRDELRTGESPSLQRRRWISLLCAVGAVDFAVISLYQVGVIRRLPDLPGDLFDSNQVNASRTAYAHRVPDGAIGLALYGLTLLLAAAGGSRQTGRRPIADLLLGGSVAAGALGAAQYLYDMAFRQARACPYCLVGAAVNFAMLPLAAREALAGIQDMLDDGRGHSTH